MFKNIVENKLNILKAWQNDLLSAFPEERALLSGTPDPFLNPVGTIIPAMLEILFDQITGEMDAEKIAKGLDDFIKLRALQDCAPSQALRFLPALKEVLHSAVGGFGLRDTGPEAIKILGQRIDDVLLKSFDLYIKCREGIYTIRINEFKKRAFRALEKIQ